MDRDEQELAKLKRNSKRWLSAIIVSAGGIITAIMVPELQIHAMVGVVGFFGYTVVTLEK